MTGTRYSFPPDDLEGRDLVRLATKRATADTLQMCPALSAHRLVEKLAIEPGESERVRTLRRLLDCVLFLAFMDWQADRSDLVAGDVLAAGTLFGLISQSPDDKFPLSLPLRTNNWTNERRQRQALRWAGSNSAGSSRSARAWRDTYLIHFREFMYAATVSGELEQCYLSQFPYAQRASRETAELTNAAGKTDPPNESRSAGKGVSTGRDRTSARFPHTKNALRTSTRMRMVFSAASEGHALLARCRKSLHL